MRTAVITFAALVSAFSAFGQAQDPALQNELALNGRRLAETKYDWQVVLSAMKKIYEQ